MLGIDPVGSDDEGQQAKMIGKDLKKDESAYGVKFLLPDLYSDCNKNRVEFEKLTSETVQPGNKNIKSVIKENKKALAKLRKLKEQNRGNEKDDARGPGIRKLDAYNESKQSTLRNVAGSLASRQRQQDSDSSDDAISDRGKQNDAAANKIKPE